jgi:Zn-dependent protease
MAHAIFAKRRGIEVKGITLFLFGGATHAKVDSQGPTDELIVSVVGPASSALLGGAFLLLHTVVAEASHEIAWGLLYLGVVNIALAIFNMLPGFPLDGGRVLRALVWRSTGSLIRATRVASIAGQVVGLLIVTAGIYFLTIGQTARAIWFAAIGWFLAQAARTSGREVLKPTPEPSEPDAASPQD